jgi:hypothetical protein
MLEISFPIAACVRDGRNRDGRRTRRLLIHRAASPAVLA